MMTQTMKVHLTNPPKDLELPGPTRVHQLLQNLNLTPEAYLVIRGDGWHLAWVAWKAL